MTDLPTREEARNYPDTFAAIDIGLMLVDAYSKGRLIDIATIDIDDLIADLHDAVIHGKTGCDFDSVVAREVLAVHGIKDAAVKGET